jgi:hypothetical protein
VQEKVCGQLPSWKSILPGTNQWGVGSTSRWNLTSSNCRGVHLHVVPEA